MEELKQKLQTQNALVRLNNPQTAQGFQPTTYPEVQAMQMRAEQLSKMYEPSIAAAIKTKNAPFLKGVAEVYRGSGVPALQKYADALSSAEFYDDGKYKVRYKFDTQEELDAMKQQMPSFAKNHPGVQVGIYYDFDLEGEWGSPQTKVYSAEPVKLEKKPEDKVHYDTTSIKDQADVESLMSQLDPKDPKTSWVKARLEKAIKERKPGEEIRARMEGVKPTGLFDITSAPKEPKIVVGGGASGDSGGSFPVLKYNDPGHYYGTLFKKSGGEQEFATLVSRFLSASVGGRNAFQAVGLSAGKQNDKKREEFLARVSDFMEQRGITQADITTAEGARSAIKQMAKQQSMMETNARVAEKGFEMVSNLRKEGKVSTNLVPQLNQVENLLRTWSGDEMPGAAQGVLTETLMDYAKVVSGQTSTAGVTMYAAKIAEDLLKLKENPAQFQKKIDQYRKLMATRLSSGKATVRGLADVSDVGAKGKVQPTLAGGIVPRRPGESVADYLKRTKK
jgi:hypothetical protein